MAPTRFLRFFVRPWRSGMDVAAGRMVLASVIDHPRDARPSAATSGDAKRLNPWVVALILAATVIGVLAGCGSPSPRPPMPAPDLPADVDRLREGVCWHELALCRAGIGGYR